MKISRSIYVLLGWALSLVSCVMEPKSSGNPYEVMVVAADSVWNGVVGDELNEILKQDMPMLPQQEAMFHLSHIEPRHYDKVTHLFRNIIIVDINHTYFQPKFELQRDLFSSPQLVVTVHGQNSQEIAEFLAQHKNYLASLLSNEEIEREAVRLEKEHNIEFDKKVNEMFGCHMNIPADVKKMKVGDNFIWASDDGLSTIQNICIYSVPYTTELQFTEMGFVNMRNKYLGDNIPGANPGSKMQTNMEFLSLRHTTNQGHYVEECRGLWEMSGEAMGGPYVAHSMVDTINNRVIVVECFVYAPNKMKRTMIRRLEAALYTVQLPTEKVNYKD